MHSHLTQNKRIELSLLLRLGYSRRQAALAIGVSPSTVSRELQRNTRLGSTYHSRYAKWYYQRRRAAANQSRTKLLHDACLAGMVEVRLKRNDAPEQIAGWLRRSGKAARGLYACAQTIYDWVYRFRHDLLAHLHCRKGKYRRTRQSTLRKAFRNSMKEQRRITKRPAHVMQRKTYGHWEGDTVVGKGRSGVVATFVERKSGYLMARLLPGRDAASFEEAVRRCFAGITKPGYKQTLTLDNGTEMANFEAMERATSLKVYFAHPYHSWERGTNENTNGLLRFYFPKQMSFAHLSQEQLDVAVKELNTRPRKRLGYRTPEEAFRLKC